MRIILLALVICLAVSQSPPPPFSVFTTTFQATSVQWGSGYFTGRLDYDWPAGYMQITFDNADSYTEFYQFNADKGYNPDVSTGQFTYQYLYKTSKSCPCETSALQYGMPPLWPASTTSSSVKGLAYWENAQNAANGVLWYPGSGLSYKLPDGTIKGYSMARNFIVDGKGVPLSFVLNDQQQQRTFTFTNLVTATTGSLGLKPPASSSCKCGKLLDIVLTLDRSGSIQNWQWNLQFSFVKNLISNFEFGSNKANFGLVNWNSIQWTTIDILSGTNFDNVNNAVNSMKCCSSKTGVNDSCCCCGTPIGGGLWGAGDMLAKSPRNLATKVIVLLTDGCQNHRWDPTKSPSAISCGCSSETACATNTACTGDITSWYTWVKRNIPGVKILVVGVGSSQTICYNQLLLAAGGDSTNVFNPQNWNDLQTIVQTISATSCTTNATVCPGCCGICTCGVCQPATQCQDQDQCNIGVVDPVTQCCTTTPKVCPTAPCMATSCDPATGCQLTPVTCRKAETCYEWYCNETSVVCATRPTNPLPVTCNPSLIPECVQDSDCEDGDACTLNICSNTTQTCIKSNIPGPADTNCTTYTCRPSTGWGVKDTKICNDKDACTTDKCDPNVQGGCVYTKITCPASEDPCKLSVCDTTAGCLIIPEPCSNITAANCTVPACNKTCFSQYICYVPPPNTADEFPTTVVVSTALGGAAVAGIAIAAVLILGGAAAGAGVAIAGGAGAGGVVAVQSNPLYSGAGTAGNNPLHKGN